MARDALLRQQRIGTLFSAICTATLGATEGTSWRFWLCAAALVGLTASMTLRGRAANLTVSSLVVLSAQCLVILGTGGTSSPLLPIILITAVFMALTTQRKRLIGFGLAALLTVALIVVGVSLRLGPEAMLPTVLTSDAVLGTLRIGIVITIGAALTLFGYHTNTAFRTEAHKTREWQERSVDAVRERNAALLSLSGAIAHELKNPLTAVQGLSTLLASRAEAGSSDARRLQVLVEEVKRMSRIVERFLNFSRPIGPLTLEPVEAEALVSDALSLHEAMASQRRVTLTQEKRDVGHLQGDRRKLHQVLTNLIQNAIEASPPDASVTVRARDDGDAVTLEVIDEGSGLDLAVKDRLFEPGVTSKPSGSGLGLAITRGLVRQHGGSLSLASRADAPGCVATLRLPRNPSIRSATTLPIAREVPS